MAKKQTVHLKINGQQREADVEPRLLLVHFIRDTLGLTGTHVGCDTSNCGACTVVFDGKIIKSCTMFAVQADGAELLTVEGLFQEGKLHPLQEGFTLFQFHRDSVCGLVAGILFRVRRCARNVNVVSLRARLIIQIQDHSV